MADSTFKLPLDVNHFESPLYNRFKQRDVAHILRLCKLVVWDECTLFTMGVCTGSGYNS